MRAAGPARYLEGRTHPSARRIPMRSPARLVTGTAAAALTAAALGLAIPSAHADGLGGPEPTVATAAPDPADCGSADTAPAVSCDSGGLAADDPGGTEDGLDPLAGLGAEDPDALEGPDPSSGPEPGREPGPHLPRRPPPDPPSRPCPRGTGPRPQPAPAGPPGTWGRASAAARPPTPPSSPRARAWSRRRPWPVSCCCAAAAARTARAAESGRAEGGTWTGRHSGPEPGWWGSPRCAGPGWCTTGRRSGPKPPSRPPPRPSPPVPDRGRPPGPPIRCAPPSRSGSVSR